MNDEMRRLLRLVVGGYLVYLAYKIISAQLAGNTGMSDAVAWISGCVLGVCGLAFCGWSALQLYRARRSAAEGEDTEVREEEP